jgi:hypothetical protein
MCENPLSLDPLLRRKWNENQDEAANSEPRQNEIETRKGLNVLLNKQEKGKCHLGPRPIRAVWLAKG